jgi:hypothetical protein
MAFFSVLTPHEGTTFCIGSKIKFVDNNICCTV